jgi:hypothetical protein
MAAAAAGLGAFGMIGQTVSGVMASDVQAKALDAEGRSIEEQAKFDERQARRDSALYQGKANATVAASGVSLSSGSPLLMELDRAKQAEIQALSIRRAGQMGVAAKRFESRLTRRQIPWQIFGGIAKTGSILSTYAGQGGFSGGSGFGNKSAYSDAVANQARGYS